MITVKATTKKGKKLLDRAIRYEGYTLWDVYENFSRYKEAAYDECKAKCYEEGGSDFRICGHCTSNFSVSWKVENGWRLETYRNSFLIITTEEEEQEDCDDIPVRTRLYDLDPDLWRKEE